MPTCTAKNAMTAADRLRIRKATTLAKGVPSSLPGGLASEDRLEINSVGNPAVTYDAAVFKPCCDTPLLYTDIPQPGDPEYTILLYISDPETGDVPRSLTRTLSPLQEYIAAGRNLDADGKRKPWKTIRAELKADRPVREKSVAPVKVERHVRDASGHITRVRHVEEKKVRPVRAVRPTASVTRSVRAGSPNAEVFIYADGPITITEYVNGVAVNTESHENGYDDWYTPTQACKLSIRGNFIFDFEAYGPAVRHIKFKWEQLANLYYVYVENVDIRGPLTLKEFPSLSDLYIYDSHIPTLNIASVPNMNYIEIYNITGLTTLDLTQLGTSAENMNGILIYEMTHLKELTIGNFPFLDVLRVYNNPALTTLTITNTNMGNTTMMDNIGIDSHMEIYGNPAINTLTLLNNGYVNDIDIYDNTIQKVIINGYSYIDNNLDIYDNTIGSLVVKNIAYMEDAQIYDNTLGALTISTINNSADFIHIYNNSGLTTLTVKNCNFIEDLYIYDNPDLTSVTIDNIYELDTLDLAGPVLTSWTLTNIYDLYYMYLHNLDAVTSIALSDPSINTTLRLINVNNNPAMTTLALSDLPSLQQLEIYQNPLLGTVSVPPSNSLGNIQIYDNTALTAIYANQASNENINAYFDSNPALVTLALSGGIYDILHVHGNTNGGKTTGLQTLDMSNIQVKYLDVQGNRLTSVVTGTQTITGQYIINLETQLTSLNLTNVTLTNTGTDGQLNVVGNSSMTSITMPATLINGLVFAMNGCNLSQATANAIEEYFFYSNSQGLNSCEWVVQQQTAGPLDITYNSGDTSPNAPAPGWNILVDDRGWNIH